MLQKSYFFLVAPPLSGRAIKKITFFFFVASLNGLWICDWGAYTFKEELPVLERTMLLVGRRNQIWESLVLPNHRVGITQWFQGLSRKRNLNFVPRDKTTLHVKPGPFFCFILKTLFGGPDLERFWCFTTFSTKLCKMNRMISLSIWFQGAYSLEKSYDWEGYDIS